MKKFFFLFSFSFCLLHATAQENIDAEFKKLTKNNSGIPYGANKAAGRFYNLRGFNMYAETYGQGQPLLIIHGNGGSIDNFVNQIPYFSKKYKVIVADSRAQGKSTDTGDSLSYEMMADDYAALLDAMKIDSAFVIGWSDGGINGLLLSIRHPQKVKKLAVTGANLWPDTTAVFQDVEDLVMPEYLSLKNNQNKNAQQKNNWKLMRLLIEEPHISLESLHTISVPTLVIGGDHDVIKPEHTLLIAQNIPNSYLWILPNSGHSTPLVYKDEFNQKIDDFFNRPYRKLEKQGRFF
ncbi:alpha/beta fold hydrolase [Flavisolibacter ginsenosidimutans]|uniref:Alpha/beta hydrolase n=1 Tax=Flavisolibacter ginsenosidimutans TaxID=661481 RepID=A0A5B8UH94_9BACT|nr:alpha/beta hydrolase [Flavisolibacter ginsenosidimutans]QEC55782.1 alpha/beta hydrolase [Flavisolibacter ginsenosidimutans]